jgi:hypothetical protein
MREEARKRWCELCALAEREENPEKLRLLNREIDRLLLEEEEGLMRRRTHTTVGSELQGT